MTVRLQNKFNYFAAFLFIKQATEKSIEYISANVGDKIDINFKRKNVF